MPERYDAVILEMKKLHDCQSVLAGEEVGPTGLSWQEVAMAAANACIRLSSVYRALALGDDSMEGGTVPLTGPVVFPSPDELDD